MHAGDRFVYALSATTRHAPARIPCICDAPRLTIQLRQTPPSPPSLVHTAIAMLFFAASRASASPNQLNSHSTLKAAETLLQCLK